MYSDEEILEHLTEGEGRGFLGRSMYDAIIGEIEQLTISLQAQEELTISWYNKTKQQNKEIERLNNIINELEKWLYDNTNYEEYDRVEKDTFNYVIKKIEELRNEEK